MREIERIKSLNYVLNKNTKSKAKQRKNKMTSTKITKTTKSNLSKENNGNNGALIMTENSILGTLRKDKIIDDFPYALRNDCKIGLWKVGPKDYKGDEIKMSIIKIIPFYGNLGKTTHQAWDQVWFIAAPEEDKIPQNVRCVTYIKKQSKELFESKLVDVSTKQDAGKGIFTGKMEAKDDYYYVNFTWRERKPEEMAQLEIILDYKKSNPTFVDTNLPPTMIRRDIFSLEEAIEFVEQEEERIAEQQKDRKKN